MIPPGRSQDSLSAYSDLETDSLSVMHSEKSYRLCCVVIQKPLSRKVESYKSSSTTAQQFIHDPRLKAVLRFLVRRIQQLVA